MRRQGILLFLLTATVVVAVQTRAYSFFPQAYALLGRLLLLAFELGLFTEAELEPPDSADEWMWSIFYGRPSANVDSWRWPPRD